MIAVSRFYKRIYTLIKSRNTDSGSIFDFKASLLLQPLPLKKIRREKISSPLDK
jgi:hypothetical protein